MQESKYNSYKNGKFITSSLYLTNCGHFKLWTAARLDKVGTGAGGREGGGRGAADQTIR